MNVTKDCLGIDVSKDLLECCLGLSTKSDEQIFMGEKKFKNDPQGFKDLLSWVRQNTKNEVLYVMEATGVYYEHLAYWLHDQGLALSVVLPNKVNYFAKSHNIKTKTDGVDARVLARMGLERDLDPWHVPSKAMREVKLLTREYRELKRKVTATKNQLHAKGSGYQCPASIIKRLKRQIRVLETQLMEVEAELRILVMRDSFLADQVERLETIPGVSFMTIICVIGETNAFALVKNAKQLASYCGLDVQHNQSGTKQGKTRISKKGNSYIRQALYMPALCATRHNPHLKTFYNRLTQKKPAKKIAVTAVARKLLILIYTLWKNETEFNPEYAVKTT